MKHINLLAIFTVTFLMISTINNPAQSIERDKRIDHNKPPSNRLANPYAKSESATFEKPIKPLKITRKPPKVNSSRNNIKVKKQIYKIPGTIAISVAKKHGYIFKVSMSSVPKGCKFRGSHWEIPVGVYCNILGFQSNIKRCAKLRSGWKLKEITFKGGLNGSAARWPRETPYPDFELGPSNAAPNAAKRKAIQIDQLTLEGPEGNFNKFEEAFSHCSDPCYSS